VQKLKEFIWDLKPVPHRAHSEVKTFLDKHLQHCHKVLVCNDTVHRPLAYRFSGPFDIIKKCEKFCVLKDSNSGVEKSISIDRLKAYHSLDEPTATSENTDEKDEPTTTLELANTTSSMSQYVSSVSFIIAAASTSFSCYSTMMYDSVHSCQVIEEFTFYYKRLACLCCITEVFEAWPGV